MKSGCPFNNSGHYMYARRKGKGRMKIWASKGETQRKSDREYLKTPTGGYIMEIA